MPPKKVIGLQSQTDMRPNWTADAQAYLAALRSAVVPEFLSMNLLMAGMVPTVTALRRSIASADDPTSARFWFVMSMGLLVGFVIAYPMNWWLVANHMKHGMIAVRPVGGAEQDAAMRHAEKSAKAHPAGMSGMADGPDRQKWRATRPPGRRACSPRRSHRFGSWRRLGSSHWRRVSRWRFDAAFDAAPFCARRCNSSSHEAAALRYSKGALRV